MPFPDACRSSVSRTSISARRIRSAAPTHRLRRVLRYSAVTGTSRPTRLPTGSGRHNPGDGVTQRSLHPIGRHAVMLNARHSRRRYGIFTGLVFEPRSLFRAAEDEHGGHNSLETVRHHPAAFQPRTCSMSRIALPKIAPAAGCPEHVIERKPVLQVSGRGQSLS